MRSNQARSISNTKRHEGHGLRGRTGQAWLLQASRHLMSFLGDTYKHSAVKPLKALLVFFCSTAQTVQMTKELICSLYGKPPWVTSGDPCTHRQDPHFQNYVDIADFPHTELSLSLSFTSQGHGQNLLS